MIVARYGYSQLQRPANTPLRPYWHVDDEGHVWEGFVELVRHLGSVNARFLAAEAGRTNGMLEAIPVDVREQMAPGL